MTSSRVVNATFGEKQDDVETPDWLLQFVKATWPIDHDPCPLGARNGLDRNVPWGSFNYVNPPYSNVAGFMERAVEEFTQRGNSSVFLVPVRTNTKYWQRYVYPYATNLYFFDRRIKFKNYDNYLPIPLCFVVFDARRPSHTPFPLVAVDTGGPLTLYGTATKPRSAAAQRRLDG